MNRYIRILYFTLIGIALIVCFQNCGPAHFTFYSTASVPGKCSTILTNTTVRLRILFMFDNSQSMLTTDPQNIRFQMLENFINKYGHKTNFSYTFGWFHNYTYLWDPSASPPSFRNNFSLSLFDAAEILRALNSFRSIVPAGQTFYENAFNGLKLAVSQGGFVNDGSSYSVVFLSDGLPEDPGINEHNGEAQITRLVNELKDKAAENNAPLTVSSIFLWNAAYVKAVINLQVMAQVGGGQYVDTNALSPGQSLDLADVITIPGEPCTP